MPELPEVETIRIGLKRHLVGKTIESVEIRLAKQFSGDKKLVEGAKITGVKRFGKGLVIELDNGYALAIHIKLTGQLIYQQVEKARLQSPYSEARGGQVNEVPARNASQSDAGWEKGGRLSKKVGGRLPNKWTHVIFKLKTQIANRKSTSQNAKLYYNDLRQFGWIKVVKIDELQTLPFFKDLGPEPPVAKALEGQGRLDLSKFKEIVQKSNLPIKVLLMDQKKIAGVGNIYANDALWLAKIDPRRKAKSLSENEIKTLYESVLHVLKQGLQYGGASELQFVNALGGEGRYQNHFLAYAQKGKPCQRCKTLMKKFTLGGRGTYVCPACQRPALP